MTTEERAEALVKRLDRSNLSEWPDIVASAIRGAENNILAQASERLEGEDAQLSPAGGSGPCARTYAQIRIVRIHSEEDCRLRYRRPGNLQQPE